MTLDDDIDRIYHDNKQPVRASSYQTNNIPPTDSLPEDTGPDWCTIDEVAKQPIYKTGLIPISTGYCVLDDVLRGGLRPESSYLLAGRTGDSKSTFALNIIRKVALDGHSVLLFKLEESPVEAVWRIHAAASQVRMIQLLDGIENVHEDVRQKLLDGWDLIHDLPIRISDERNLEAIEKIAISHVTDKGKLIVIDQVSMVEVADVKTSYERVTRVSNVLRRLARDLHVPILTITQINRGASKSKEPLSVNDLRDSGCLENDAAAVIFINKVRKPDGPRLGGDEPIRYLDILIGKNRYGPTTDPENPLTLTWWPAQCRIEDYQGVRA